MNLETLDTRVAELETEWCELVRELIPTIGDDYRAYEPDPGSDDDAPSMLLTIGSDAALSSWGYQTGDNSYSGAAYFFPHWAVVALYRDSVPAEVAKQIGNELADLIAQSVD